ncbi:MAG: aminotransferase class V-fold PLP-dependent enzyme [Micropepsaceae bacterium]
MTAFGRKLRPDFLLQADGIFLNNGSFGSVPAPVRAAQQAWRDTVETQPDIFFRETIYTATRAAAARLARLCGTSGDALVFTPNVTEAVAVVLAAMDFHDGDEILLLDVAYAAVRRAVDVTCRRTGATVRTIPTGLQMTPAADAEGLKAGLTPRTRLVILDHIVSPTAQRVPVEDLLPLAKAHGARVFIDGAHALGQAMLNLDALGADWYATNAHKWLFTPRGSCVLYAGPEVRAVTRPAIVSHYYEDAYPRNFDYVGTRDVTAYLAAADGADYLDSLGLENLTAHRAALIAAANAALGKFGATLVTPHAPALAAWALPQSREADPADGLALMKSLWDEAKIQTAANLTHGRLLLRLSLHAYVDFEDIAALAAALDRLGWPGR